MLAARLCPMTIRTSNVKPSSAAPTAPTSATNRTGSFVSLPCQCQDGHSAKGERCFPNATSYKGIIHMLAGSNVKASVAAVSTVMSAADVDGPTSNDNDHTTHVEYVMATAREEPVMTKSITAAGISFKSTATTAAAGSSRTPILPPGPTHVMSWDVLGSGSVGSGLESECVLSPFSRPQICFHARLSGSKGISDLQLMLLDHGATSVLIRADVVDQWRSRARRPKEPRNGRRVGIRCITCR